MITYFEIEAQFDKSNIYPWANTIAREFLENLDEAVSGYGYKIITQGDDGNGGKRETITTAAETAELKNTYYCDFQIEDADGMQSMWFRLVFASSKAQCGVINLLRIAKVTKKDFRGLTVGSRGRTDFLASYLVKEPPEGTAKPLALKKNKAKFADNPTYYFKVLVNRDIIVVWCAEESPDEEVKEGFFKAYANVLSLIKVMNTTLALPATYLCNGLATGIVNGCNVYVPAVAANQRTNKIQTGRILLTSLYTGMFEWINRYCILIPNFSEYEASDFEITVRTPFHVLCEDKYIKAENIETYGYLDSIAGTKKLLVAFVEDWRDDA